jgi:hypothetical protein
MARSGKAQRGKAGVVGLDMVRHGLAGSGGAWPGRPGTSGAASLVQARHGAARHVAAGIGMAGAVRCG